MRINWHHSIRLICKQCGQKTVYVGIIWIDCENCTWGIKRYEFR